MIHGLTLDEGKVKKRMLKAAFEKISCKLQASCQ